MFLTDACLRRIIKDALLTGNFISPVPASRSCHIFCQQVLMSSETASLFMFLTARFAGSFDNLGCGDLLGIPNPIFFAESVGCVCAPVAQPAPPPVPTIKAAQSGTFILLVMIVVTRFSCTTGSCGVDDVHSVGTVPH